MQRINLQENKDVEVCKPVYFTNFMKVIPKKVPEVCQKHDITAGWDGKQ